MKYNVQSREMEALGEARILLACRKPFPLVYGFHGSRVSELLCNFSLHDNGIVLSTTNDYFNIICSNLHKKRVIRIRDGFCEIVPCQTLDRVGFYIVVET